MQKRNDEILYSASDIVNFLECEHLTTLDRINLVTPLPAAADDEEAALIQAKGVAHEMRYVETLKGRHATFVDISVEREELDEKVARTEAAMRGGVEIIYQAALRDGALVGHADFLRRVPRPSKLGEWSYEVLDTKLARSAKAKFVVQLVFYSALVARVQGVMPLQMHVVLGDQSEVNYRCADFSRYLGFVTRQFLERVAGNPPQTYPDPCERCDLCRWRDLCEARRLADDHLCQVANITKVQTRKLQQAGVTTLAALAGLPEGRKIPKLAAETLFKLRSQAALQRRGAAAGKPLLELLPPDAEGLRGFARLPAPDTDDLFFDMEGDPFEEGGLEYLFGLYFMQGGKPVFKPFWAHSRAEERRTFEAFMDFVTGRLKQHPGAHVYHYAHYEQTALKKLMSLHGTREAEVDNLLRAGKMIDLYKVVREAMRVSEPRYSLKNIEHFYLAKRDGVVRSAGASIVHYERWKETGDPVLLDDIARYNREDVRSTFEMRDWLLTCCPQGLAWAKQQAVAGAAAPAVGELTDAEKRLIPYRESLIDPLPADRTNWGPRAHLRELTFQLLDFHRRSAKPSWWAMYARMEMDDDELHEDFDCLGGLVLDAHHPPEKVKRSVRYTYTFPEQETKLKDGDPATVVQTGASVRELTIDHDRRKVCFLLGDKNEPLPTRISLGPGKPISTGKLTDAAFRFADSVVAEDKAYPAIEDLLGHARPRLRRHRAGDVIVADGPDPLPRIIDAIARLDRSCVFVQGPPGAGKTYTGARVIVALLRLGKRIGVSSNSHKVIHNLLEEVERVSRDEGFVFRGVKKSTAGSADTEFDGDCIASMAKGDEVAMALGGGASLVAGTAWLFADPAFDRQLDYVFVDEAGQVSLANLVAIGTSAKNIVLLGDQMQLSQPIQGVHPGRSGESSLEYLLDGAATIAPDAGIFLGTTWRMHPDVCRFISEAVYDGRLQPEPRNATQTLLLGADAHPALKPTGVEFLPADHDGCAQSSEEEAAVVSDLVESLLRQRYRDKFGKTHALDLDNILVVAPYNLQVKLLKKTLPAGARVGTVDKFQGQEAEVVLISMSTSSGEYLPRNIEFLFSKNRLNVAISRAKCLAIFIANPALMSIRCATPEQMALVNLMCWVREAN